ncbi:Peptidase C78, ubiquitin fold modifier-specific peptidase 1/ 2 [Cordyceps fumosorosea ARSEF 2679]|uniref:Peptidase C78, ubiquitin fold modifier-specific peptidase 1/ 2 n=1 Tax=Cordyceps fumosorosea (strain ARSEF 2679) TaxID=1081104 RepID=A0A167YDW9_CORFA|nr:Peptidase C78, ubiquitin fold modifier-specific peptidase 1/ 2 [Cordyceps fumosorosea ARSEF 2679]OAA66219.1 Peptidase C78, ubiquitin fold modifier-specific peptidase 1/ 2 [Cordyceps fumosorosea ARSEF 2679]
MLISHLILATETGPRTFPDGVPSIFQLQDQIEAAWDHGYNSRGRDETGGIRGTRKFIGTQEVRVTAEDCLQRPRANRAQAQALFSYLKVNCSALRYQDSREISAVDQVFDAIESYYQCSLTKPEDARNKVQCTMLAPIYFQRPGHSLTVIGLQKTMHNERHLLVFNPGHRYKDTPPSLPQRQRPDVLEPYRLRAESLRKYSEFELL